MSLIRSRKYTICIRYLIFFLICCDLVNLLSSDSSHDGKDDYAL